MTFQTGVVLTILLGNSFLGQTSKPDRPDRGQWSGEATALLTTLPGDWTSGRRQSIPSPDQQKLILVRDDKVFLEVKGKAFTTNFGLKNQAELGWSPDSNYFFLTWTDGGEIGTWHTELYSVSNAGPKRTSSFEVQARKDFARRIRRLPVPPDFAQEPGRGFWLAKEYCYPNVVGAQWLNGSQELLVSVLVPNVGICRYASEFNVYRLAIPSGRILERYSASEAHQKFNPENLPRIAE